VHPPSSVRTPSGNAIELGDAGGNPGKSCLFSIRALAWFLDPDNGSHRRESVKRTLQEKGLMTPPSATTMSADTDPVASAFAAVR
jgi:hypothetical protein